MKKSLPKLSEQELIHEISIKSKKGAEVLFDMYSKNLYGVIFRILNSRENAEDVLQQVLIKVWDSIENYDASKGRLFTWMLTISRNAAKDSLRSTQHQRSLITDEIENHLPQIDKSFHVIFNNDVLFIRSMVTKLKRDQNEIIDLIYFKGYTHTEVAEKLGIPLGTVKTRCRAGISVLRDIFIPAKASVVHLLAS